MIGNNKIKNVRSFKYLGFTITNDEEDKFRFLHARIGAEACFDGVYYKLF